MPPNRFESEVESFLEGSHGDRTHIKRADHHTVTPLCGTLLPAPRMKHSPPLHGDPAPRMEHSPPPHGNPAPRMKHFPPLHGMDRAIMKFLSPTHTQNDQFPTIFSVLGRYFFHRGTPHDHTVLRRGDISFMQPLKAPPPWQTPKEPSTPRDAKPGRGAERSRQSQASEKSHAIRLEEVSTTSENVAIPTI